MKGNNLRESAGVETTQSIQSASNHQLKKFTPDEIFEKIDQLRSGFEPAPSVLDQFLSAGKRDYARAIEEAKISAIKTRKAFDRWARQLRQNLCGRACRGLEGNRAVEFVTETFDRITLHLESVSDEVISGYYDLYMKFVDEIKRKKLPHELEEEALKSAIARLRTREKRSSESIGKILNNLTNEIIRFSQEVGRG